MWVQWRSQGGPRGPWPPKLVVNVFFCAMNCCCYVEVARKCTKMSRNWGNCIDLHPYLPETFLPLPPPPLNVEGHEKFLLSATTPPPPYWRWCAHRDPGKFLLLLPLPTESGRLPEMTQKVAGGIGRVPPPQTKILATPLCGCRGISINIMKSLSSLTHESCYMQTWKKVCSTSCSCVYIPVCCVNMYVLI